MDEVNVELPPGVVEQIAEQARAAALAGQEGELKCEIEIKRAATGQVERYSLTGRINGLA